VQTFITDSFYSTTAYILDDKRLNKQITEAGQIIDILAGKKVYYVNHPAVRMWVGNVDALKYYYNIMLKVWLERGKNYKNPPFKLSVLELYHPTWTNDERVHETHKQRLLQKDYEFYKPKFPNIIVDNSIDYLWPVMKNDIAGMEYVNKMVKKNKYKVEFEEKDYYLTRLIRN
jgi:hypothetical protein